MWRSSLEWQFTALLWVVDLCGTYRLFGKVEDLEMVDASPDHRGLWQIRSNGRPLTNVLIPAN